MQSCQLPRVVQASCLCRAAAPAGKGIVFLMGIRLRVQGVTSSGTLPGWEGRSAPQGFLLFSVHASHSRGSPPAEGVVAVLPRGTLPTPRGPATCSRCVAAPPAAVFAGCPRG